MPELIICGIDPGPINNALAVVSHRGVEKLELIELEDDLTRAASVWKATIRKYLRWYDPSFLAVEEYQWYGAYTKASRAIYERIALVRSFSEDVRVEVIPAGEWQAAIVGQRVQGMGRWWSKPNYKRAVRAALCLRLQTMGVDGEVLLGPDRGGHLADSLGLSLYVFDKHRIMRNIHVMQS